MEYRRLGASGLFVPVLTLGTGTFGGKTDFFKPWGALEVRDAARLVDICLDAGLNMFDTADVYSNGQAEEILGAAIAGRRDSVLISTKATFRHDAGPNDVGSSRFHLIRAVDAGLHRLKTDYIDLFQLHGFDALTPVDEVLRALDDLVRAGKIRYIGASNFSGWHLMKSLAVSDRYGLSRYVAHQAYYSLIGREYEWELMPLGSIRASAPSSGARSDGPGLPARFAGGSRGPRSRACRTRPTSTAGRRSPMNTSMPSSTCSTRSPLRPARRFHRSR